MKTAEDVAENTVGDRAVAMMKHRRWHGGWQERRDRDRVNPIRTLYLKDANILTRALLINCKQTRYVARI